MNKGMVAGMIIMACVAVTMAGTEIKGKVTETGFGKFKMKDSSDTERLFYIEKKTSTYEPSDWRPIEGDQVTISYNETESRGKTKLVVDKVKLDKASPNTVQIKSPVKVEIREAGRSGYKVKISDSGKPFKFDKDRNTQVVPAGWQPKTGEKATVTFKIEESTFTFGLKYIAEKIEKE